jgi:hypothetical protein
VAEIDLARALPRVREVRLQAKLTAKCHAQALQRGDLAALARLNGADDGLRHARPIGELPLGPSARNPAGPDRHAEGGARD